MNLTGYCNRVDIVGRPAEDSADFSRLFLASVFTLHVRGGEQSRDRESEALEVDGVCEYSAGHGSGGGRVGSYSCTSAGFMRRIIDGPLLGLWY